MNAAVCPFLWERRMPSSSRLRMGHDGPDVTLPRFRAARANGCFRRREPAEGQLGWGLRSAEPAPRSAAARNAAESGDIHTGLVSILEKRHPTGVRTTSKW
jgi:hypothetical protein